MPARNRDWKRFGSVAVTQFQRRVCRNALKWRRRVEALGAQVAPRFLLQDATVDLEVPVDLQGLTLGIVIGAGQAHPSGLLGRLLDRLDQPAARTHLDQIADAPRAVRNQFGNAIQVTASGRMTGGSCVRSAKGRHSAPAEIGSPHREEREQRLPRGGRRTTKPCSRKPSIATSLEEMPSDELDLVIVVSRVPLLLDIIEQPQNKR